MTEPAAEPLLSPKEAAALLGVSRRTVLRMLYEGSLPGERLRSRSPWRVYRCEVIRMRERLRLTA